jgi:mitotic spindle assembly checkpoint protein MAD1
MKSREFREVCYQLTGYKIDFHYTKQYKVTSMYAERRDDFFIFQVSFLSLYLPSLC